MNIKVGDTVKYENHYIEYSVDFKRQTLTKPKQGMEIKEVRIVAKAKGTDFHNSDWIVCYPKDWPQTDLRSHSKQKIWGIDTKQILEVVQH